MPDRPSPEIVRAKRAEISRRYSRPRKHATKPQFASIRIAELCRLYRARYGQHLPNNEVGRDCLLIVAQHLIQLTGHPRERIYNWAVENAPWLSLPEGQNLAGEVAMHPQTWTADQLAWRLKLTYADRQTLKISTIGAIDCSKVQRTKLRKKRQKERMKKLRQGKRLAACAP